MRGVPQNRAGAEFDVGPEYRPSDEELGVGEADETEPLGPEKSLDELMKRPDIAAAVDLLIADRVRQAAVATAPLPAASNDATAGMIAVLVAALEKNAAVHGAQQPGHIKPLSAEEIEARAQAYIEMQALIATAYAQQSGPSYLLTEDFYANDELWPKGDTLIWYGVPNTEMEPQNAIAAQIFKEKLRWIGGPPRHISDLVGDAVRGRPEQQSFDVASYSPSGTPSMTEMYHPKAQFVNGAFVSPLAQRVDVPRRDIGPTRITGTIVPEERASVRDGPVRLPSAMPIPVTGTVAPNAQPSPIQSF